MAARYLYAIVPSEQKISFDVESIEEGPHAKHPARPGAPHDAGGVYAVPHDGLAAVVSPVGRAFLPVTRRARDCPALPKEQAVRLLLAHERVVEAVMQTFPALPVKFGTVLPDEAWVRRLLAQGNRAFRAALQQFAGLVQMEVMVSWNLEDVFREIAQEEPVAHLRATNLAPEGPNAKHPARAGARQSEGTMAQRVALGQLVQASLSKRRADLQQRLTRSLAEVAVDMVQNAPMDDSTVANIGLLVDDAGRGALDKRLERLDREFGGRLLFRCVGPLPPYSFATVEVQTPSFDDVDDARRRLGLGETASPPEIRQAYRRVAGEAHPDLNPDDPNAAMQMVELNRAYGLLAAYAEHVAAGRGADRVGPTVPGRPCAFTKDAVADTMLIKILRQGSSCNGQLMRPRAEM